MYPIPSLGDDNSAGDRACPWWQLYQEKRLILRLSIEYRPATQFTTGMGNRWRPIAEHLAMIGVLFH